MLREVPPVSDPSDPAEGSRSDPQPSGPEATHGSDDGRRALFRMGRMDRSPGGLSGIVTTPAAIVGDHSTAFLPVTGPDDRPGTGSTDAERMQSRRPESVGSRSAVAKGRKSRQEWGRPGIGGGLSVKRHARLRADFMLGVSDWYLTRLREARMTGRARRHRRTIASLMASVGALSLLMALVRPVVRHGRPPCMSPVATARWLLTRPGLASCNECHSGLGMADRVRALLPAASSAKACPAAASLGEDPRSCVACHAK
jgi:hypothetical protein